MVDQVWLVFSKREEIMAYLSRVTYYFSTHGCASGGSCPLFAEATRAFWKNVDIVRPEKKVQYASRRNTFGPKMMEEADFIYSDFQVSSQNVCASSSSNVISLIGQG
jgi:hypothetical protein